MNSKIFGSSRKKPAFIGLLAGVFLFAFCHGVQTARAQADSEGGETEQIEIIKKVYIVGARFFFQKRYREAAIQFELAYKLLSEAVSRGDRSPKILKALQKLRYFLGVCYYNTKEYFKAEKYLKEYLNNSPITKESRRKKAQKMLAEVERELQIIREKKKRELELKKKREKEKQKEKVKIIIKQPPPKKGPKYTIRAWPFVILGLGAATLATGGVISALIPPKEEELLEDYNKLKEGNPSPPAKTIAEKYNSIHQLALTANGLFIGGGVVTGTGIILSILFAKQKISPKENSKPTKNSVRIVNKE